MRKKIVFLVFILAALAPTTGNSPAAAAKASAAQSASKGCPKGSHLVTCPTYSFCCPNNAFCVCSP